MTVRIDKLALIGIGLLGASIARACRRAGCAETIVCADINADHRREALTLGLVEEAHEDPAKAVAGADMVILCIPVGACADAAAAIRDAMKPGAILSDVGSVKEMIARSVAPHVRPDVHFIPAHPVAGTEQSGPSAGFAELFDNRWCIITPLENTDEAALRRLTAFWQALGSRTEIMDAKHHDLVLAITSHVPHLIAYNIVITADDLETVTEREVIKYSAGGFRDFTRIAASDPVMWRDVFLNNREAVLEMLGRFSEDLSMLQRAIRSGDGKHLYELFSRSRRIRRAIIDAGQETPAPNFGRNMPADKTTPEQGQD